jgi:AcrR family transcriptional regulator
VEEVALRAGVSKGTLFLYYASKEELFKAVIQANLNPHFIAWDQEFVQFQGDTAAMLHYGLSSWWERIGNTLAGGLTKLVFSESKNFPEVAAYYREHVVATGQALLQKVLQRGVDRGELQAVDVKMASLSLMSAMMFVLMWRHAMSGDGPGPDFDPHAFLMAHLETILRGLARPATKQTKEPHENQ